MKTNESLSKWYERLKNTRVTWESHWDEAARFLSPASEGLFNGTPRANEGEKDMTYVFDASPMISKQRFVAALFSMLTPRTMVWHMLKPLAKKPSRALKQWAEEANTTLYRQRYLPKANFVPQMQATMDSAGALGTGAMYIDWDNDHDCLRYATVPLPELFIDVNHQGVVDTVFRRRHLAAGQVVEMFSKKGDFVPEAIRSKAQANPDDKVEIVHAVFPRDSSELEGKTMKKKWVSVHFDADSDAVMREGGYDTFPYVLLRPEVAPEETYGRGPGIHALPNIKLLNLMKRDYIKVMHQLADPAIAAHDDAAIEVDGLTPGSIVWGGIDHQGRRLVQTLDRPQGQFNHFAEAMEAEKRTINDMFYVSLFEILTDKDRMTATEVLERTREKGMLLAPGLGRLQGQDGLAGMLVREMALLKEHGKITAPPRVEGEKNDYEVIFESPLNRAERTGSLIGVIRYLEITMQVATATGDDSGLLALDPQATAEFMADELSVPLKIMRTPQETAQIKEQRAEQQQMQQAIEAAGPLSQLMKAQQGGA